MALQSKQSAIRSSLAPLVARQQRWLRQLQLWPRRSIRGRLQLSHLLASLVPLLVLGAVLLYTSVQSERRMVEETQLSVVRSVASDLSETLLQFEYDLSTLGRQLAVDSPEWVVRARTADFMQQHAPNVVDLSVLDRAGNEIVRLSATRSFGTHELTNRSNSSFFRTVLQGWPQREIIDAGRGRRVLQLAVPARTSTQRIGGVVVIQLSTQSMERKLFSVPASTSRSTFLIDDQGKILLGQPAASFALPQWASSLTPHSILQGSDGKLVSAARAPVQPSSWFVVVEQPTDVAFDNQRRNTWLLAAMLTITASGVVVWGLVVARRMTTPILQLRDGVQTVGAGHLGDTIPVDREDEIGELALEFNRMSERLADSHRAIELRNARLAESQKAIEARNRQLREGLDLARQVQRDLLPQGLPQHVAIRAEASSEPAAEIGGDFYTYVPLSDGRLRLIIGDASGKGVAAALVMALTSSLVEVHAREAAGPADLLNRLNAELYPRFSANHMCVALLATEFDPERQRVCVANAGMITPYVVDARGGEYVPAFGPPLGVLEHADFVETAIDLELDQTVVFISDGIVEARNSHNAMWGFKGFETTMMQAAHGGPQQIVADVLAAVKQHSQETAPADDITIIAACLSNV